MITVFVIDVVIGFLAAFLLFGPAIYAGVHVLPEEEPVDYPVAAATAVVAVLAAGAVDALLGWVPVVGLLLSPIVWSVIVKRFLRTSWYAGLLVGFATWGLSRLLYAGLPGG